MNKIQTSSLPGHVSLLHNWISVLFPSHRIPPKAGLGLSQLLTRCCEPPPQEWEHSENDVQFPQLPFILSEISKMKLLLFFQIAHWIRKGILGIHWRQKIHIPMNLVTWPSGIVLIAYINLFTRLFYFILFIYLFIDWLIYLFFFWRGGMCVTASQV